MPQKRQLIQLPLIGKVLLGVLAGVYILYLAGLVRSWYPSLFAPSQTIVEQPVSASASAVLGYWTADSMSSAVSADEQDNNSSDFQSGNATSQAGTARQQGQPPQNGDASTYPLSTVGKVFFTNASGQNMVCSGSAVVSKNRSVVDTAGHCLYWNKGWVKNFIFCPLYDHGNGPSGCWAARDLEVPSDWINARANDLHHDMGMAVVAANDKGLLTDVVGGAGWIYNQPVTQPFYAYGYPAAYPFDGQSLQKCENVNGKSWPHGGGTVVSIPCGLTGGSSGGPWFLKIDGNVYVDGHNDFISSMAPGQMFSPVYDDTWFALYTKAQNS